MLIKAAHRSRFTVIPMTGNIREVRVTAGEDTLEGNLSIPANAGGIVLFAHGSGSSRLSPRNRFVAHVLAMCAIGTRARHWGGATRGVRAGRAADWSDGAARIARAPAGSS